MLEGEVLDHPEMSVFDVTSSLVLAGAITMYHYVEPKFDAVWLW